jgi:5-methylcytosine-specific restriction endonuclease McrA
MMPKRPPILDPLRRRPGPAPKRRPTPRDGRYHGAEWEATRKRVLVRDGFHCRAENCPTPSRGARGRLIVHHLVAVEDGGSDDDGNLSTRCPTCHERAHRRAST